MKIRTSKCRSCGALIFFAKTERGKWIPVDGEPDPEGNLEIIPGHPPLALEIRPLLPPAKRYVSHFATCPQADRFRK